MALQSCYARSATRSHAGAVQRCRTAPASVRSRRGAVVVRSMALPEVDFQTATYAALGSAALSFCGTFLVAPRFKQYFKEPVDWPTMYQALTQRGVKTITVEEAYAKSRKGAVLLDVRLEDRFLESAPAGAVNVPLYQPIQGWDVPSNIRRAGFAFFGIFGTELNVNFSQDALALLPKGKEVIVLCECGGTLENKPGVQTGFQSRSLKAVYYLQQAGYTKLFHVKGGVGEWVRADLPMVMTDNSDMEEEVAEEEQRQPQPQTVPLALAQVSSFFGRKA